MSSSRGWISDSKTGGALVLDVMHYMDPCLNVDATIYICNTMQYDDQVQNAATTRKKHYHGSKKCCRDNAIFPLVILPVVGGEDCSPLVRYYASGG